MTTKSLEQIAMEAAEEISRAFDKWRNFPFLRREIDKVAKIILAACEKAVQAFLCQPTAQPQREQPPVTDKQAEGSPWREWTPEYVGSLVGETFNGAWKIADAHNAALADARQEGIDWADKQYYGASGHQRIRDLEQQLAEREKTLRWCKHWEGVALAHDCESLTDAFVELTKSREQLAAAQAAIANIKAIARKFSGNKEIGNYFWELKQEIEAINVDLSALEQHDAEVREPLVDALKRMPEVAYESIIEGTGVTPENLPNELQCIADDALAKAYPLPDGRTK